MIIDQHLGRTWTIGGQRYRLAPWPPGARKDTDPAYQIVRVWRNGVYLTTCKPPVKDR